MNPVTVPTVNVSIHEKRAVGILADEICGAARFPIFRNMTRSIFLIIIPILSFILYLHQKRSAPICVVSTIFNDYDDPPDLPNDDRIKYIMYTDRPIMDKRWISVTTPYWKREQYGYKNSIGNTKHEAMMKSKFYKLFAWSLPETFDCRTILYIDAQVIIANATNLYERILALNPDGKMFMQLHQHNRDVSVELVAAKQQVRYVRDGVENQTRHYFNDYRFPYKTQPLFLGGMFIYDPRVTDFHRMFRCVYRECQLWSYEDQISFPFCIWLEKVNIVHMRDMCTRVFGNAPKLSQELGMPICIRGYHKK